MVLLDDFSQELRKIIKKKVFFFMYKKKFLTTEISQIEVKIFFDDLKLHLIYNGWDPGVL